MEMWHTHETAAQATIPIQFCANSRCTHRDMSCCVVFIILDEERKQAVLFSCGINCNHDAISRHTSLWFSHHHMALVIFPVGALFGKVGMEAALLRFKLGIRHVPVTKSKLEGLAFSTLQRFEGFGAVRREHFVA